MQDYASQKFDLYSADVRVAGKQASASVGNKHGKITWWINFHRLNSHGQPLSCTTRALSNGVVLMTGIPVVSGAFAGKNGRGGGLVGDGCDCQLSHCASSPQTEAYPRPHRHAAFAPALNTLGYRMLGLSLKSHTKGKFDCEAALGLVDCRKDVLRVPAALLPGAIECGAGRITDMHGTGWCTLNSRDVWRPSRQKIDFGYQHDKYRLRTLVRKTNAWIGGAAGARFSASNGNTQLKSVFAQHTWNMADVWKSTLGGRYQRWHAYGRELGNGSVIIPFGQERESHFSIKAALAHRMADRLAPRATTLRLPGFSTTAQIRL